MEFRLFQKLTRIVMALAALAVPLWLMLAVVQPCAKTCAGLACSLVGTCLALYAKGK